MVHVQFVWHGNDPYHSILFRCLVWWRNLLLDYCCLTQNQRPAQPAFCQNQPLQNQSLFHFLGRIPKLISVAMRCVVQPAYVIFWQLQHTLSIATGVSLIMPSCVRCLAVGVLFPLFPAHQLNGTTLNGNESSKCEKRFVSYVYPDMQDSNSEFDYSTSFWVI